MNRLAAICLTVTVALPALAQAPGDKMVVPGQRIGQWTMAMTIEDLLKLNGPKRAVGAPEGETEIPLRNLRDSTREIWAHRWDHLRLRPVTFGRDDQKVRGLTTSDASFKTAQGIGIGSTRQEMVAAYGPPTAITEANDRQTHVIYDSLGISFRVSKAQEKIDLINVFTPDTARERWKY